MDLIDEKQTEQVMTSKSNGHLMTIFRAKVAESQVNDIVLPEPEQLNRQDAVTLANWAATNGVPAQDDPSLPLRIKEMFGFRAALILPQLKKSLAGRIGTHVAVAAKHSLVVELVTVEDGFFFQVTRQRAKAPDLTIRHSSAMMLLEAMGVLSPLDNEEREISLIKTRLARSQAKCIDICMGHYHERLDNVVSYAENNKASMIEWRTYDPAITMDPFADR